MIMVKIPSSIVEMCGYLEMLNIEVNTSTKIELSIPNGTLIDISASYYGANCLVENNGVRNVFFIGKSHTQAISSI